MSRPYSTFAVCSKIWGGCHVQAAQGVLRNPSVGLAAAAEQAAGRAAAGSGPATAAAAAAGAGSRARPMERFEIDAAQNGGSQGLPRPLAVPEEEDIWEKTFKGAGWLALKLCYKRRKERGGE
jgi:hypothetical protein